MKLYDKFYSKDQLVRIGHGYAGIDAGYNFP